MPNQQYTDFNCYEALGISANVSPEGIRSAYRTASLTSHPDRGGSHEAQVRINLAYEVLSNPIDRQAHDIFWRISRDHTPSSPPVHSARSAPRSAERSAPLPRMRGEPFAGLKRRVSERVEAERAAIWRDLDNRARQASAKFRQELSAKRRGTFVMATVALGLGFCGLLFPLCFLGALAFAAASAARVFSGIRISGRVVSLFAGAASLQRLAGDAAKEACAAGVGSLDRHFSSLASLSELLLRSSSFDDSEEHIARRLSAAFFLMGYMPIRFDRENRLLIFSDGEENLLVRFRHRRGAATNVAYVRALVDFMKAYRVSRGFVFCSPGLSGNAETYASANGVRGYALETMNEWIERALVSDYDGPAGDILSNLEKFKAFLSSLSLAMPAPRRSWSRYRRFR